MIAPEPEDLTEPRPLFIPTFEYRTTLALEKIVTILERFEAMAERIPFLKGRK